MPDEPAKAESEQSEEDKKSEAQVPGEEAGGDKRRDRIFILLLLVIIAAYLGTFLTLTLLRYSNYRGSEFDTAIFNQVVWLLSRFKGAYSTIRGTNLFGDHFAPTQALQFELLDFIITKYGFEYLRRVGICAYCHLITDRFFLGTSTNH